MNFSIIIPNTRVNGIKTYVYHLTLGLMKLGVAVQILKPHNRNEYRGRKFIGNITYLNKNAESIKDFAAENYCLISELLSFEDKELLTSLINDFNVVPMTHRSKDYFIGEKELLSKNGIVIRRKLLDLVPNSVFIEHPYHRTYLHKTAKRRIACSMTRLESEKNTHIVLDSIINYNAKIDLYGPLMPFYGMKLNKLFPNWKSYWSGAKKYEEIHRILSDYRYSIDLSSFKKDGAGTQYSFLEALDCGCIPIVHEDWLGGVYKDGETCLAVNDALSLKKALRKHLEVDQEKILKKHDSKRVARKILNHCIKVKRNA